MSRFLFILKKLSKRLESQRRSMYTIITRSKIVKVKKDLIYYLNLNKTENIINLIGGD